VGGAHEILPYYLLLRSCLRTAALVLVFARYAIKTPFKLSYYIFINLAMQPFWLRR